MAAAARVASGFAVPSDNQWANEAAGPVKNALHPEFVRICKEDIGPRPLPFASGMPRLRRVRQCADFAPMILSRRSWPFRPLKVVRMDRFSLESLCTCGVSWSWGRRAAFPGEGYRPKEIIVIKHLHN